MNKPAPHSFEKSAIGFCCLECGANSTYRTIKDTECQFQLITEITLYCRVCGNTETYEVDC